MKSLKQEPAHNQPPKLVSIVVPVYNEAAGIKEFYIELDRVLKETPYVYEVIFVNDGSYDASQGKIELLAADDNRIKYIEFSRNFGKEIATTSGLNHATGDAVLCIDCDMQHPPRYIPEFLDKWKNGAEVVVGVRNQDEHEGWIKHAGSFWFYLIMNQISETKIEPRATDFRLMDRIVVDEFNRLSERNRITRGLIDWLGFRRDSVYFDTAERAHGKASYNIFQLTRLGVNSIISLSLFPLRFAAYLGGLIIVLSGSLGVIMIIDRYIIENWLNFSGTAVLANIIIFLVGIILVILGVLAFYIGNIHQEAQRRPLYVIRRKRL